MSSTVGTRMHRAKYFILPVQFRPSPGIQTYNHRLITSDYLVHKHSREAPSSGYIPASLGPVTGVGEVSPCQYVETFPPTY